MTHPAQKRLEKLIALREAEEVSADRSQHYIDDLNILIEAAKEAVKNMNAHGFEMVE